MKITRIILGALLVLFLGLAFVFTRRDNSSPLLNELVFLLAGVPIILLNFWAWLEPQVFAPKPTAEETPADSEAVAGATPLKLVEVARALGLTLGIPLLLFILVGLLSPQTATPPLLIAVIAAALATARLLRSRLASLNAILVAWLALILVVPGIALWPRTMLVEGYLTDAQNKPLTQTVQLLDAKGQTHETQTGSDGYYKFPAVPRGEYSLLIGKNKIRGATQGIFTREIRQNLVVGLPVLATRTPKPTITPTPTMGPPPEVPAATEIATTQPDGPEAPPAPDFSVPFLVYADGILEPNLVLSAMTSSNATDWFSTMPDGEICMYFPESDNWGEVSITVGEPLDPPRPGMDFSGFRSISFELMGEQGNEFLMVAMKDNADPDDRTEIKRSLPGITTEWQTFRFPLSEFSNADLSKLFVVIKFIFENSPAENVCFRNIQFLP